MVASIRKLVNITHSTTSIANISDNLTPNPDINMVINPVNNIFNISDGFEEGRGCSLSLSMYKPRSSLISSSKCSKDYHICVKRKSDRMNENEPVSSIGSIKIEYASQEGHKDQISKVTGTTNNMFQQYVSSKDWNLNPSQGNSIFNINLNYNIDQALDPEE